MELREHRDAEDIELSVLVLRCQTGDEGAFARLFGRFAPHTLGYLDGLVGQDAEDLQQEVWLRVYRHLGGLANPHAFRTWLYRLTRHAAFDHLRRQRRSADLFVDDVAADDIADPSATLDLEDTRLLTPDLLEGLPAPPREALLLRHRDDLTYAEIAAVAGCSVGTVRSRLHYARQRLEQLLREHGDTTNPFDEVSE